MTKGLFSTDEKPLNFEYMGIIRYIPLLVCGGFFIFTIILFTFGPYDWGINNITQLYGFLLLCIVALISGYIIAVKFTKNKTQKIKINTNLIFSAGAIVFLALYIPTLLATTGKWYPDIITGLLNTGKAYRNTKYYHEFGNQTVLYIRMVLSPFIIMIIPLTLFCMPKLKRVNKVLGIIMIILTVFMNISQGMNKAFADFTAQMVLLLITLFFSNTPQKSKIVYRLKIVAMIMIICSTFFAYYTISMRNRIAMDQDYLASQNSDVSGSPDITPVSDDVITESMEAYSSFDFGVEKPDYFLFRMIPEKLKAPVMYLSSYLSHGYKGLSIAMQQEFTSSYGLGFSDFFRHNFLKVLSMQDFEESIKARTYPAKTNRLGWETGSFWSSFFVYPASDITFPGTVLLVFMIGYLFALSWKDALSTEDPFAVVVFFGFCTMIFYFSANNQMFQGGENFIGFVTMILLWFFSRKFLVKNCSLSN